MVEGLIYFVNRILGIINIGCKFFALFLFIFLSLFSISHSIGQTNTWDGLSDANWNTAANWSLNHVPLATEDVVIPDGITATITINTAAVCSTFTISDGNQNNTVTISGTNSLTVTNGITIGIATATKNKILDVAAGTLTCSSITFTGSTALNRASRLTLSTGTVNVAGSITMGSAFDELTFSGAGTINVGGTISGGTFTAATGTVNYNGAAQTVGAYNYYNLSLSGSGSKDLSGVSSISNNFSTSGTANAIAGSSMTISGNVTLGSGSTFTGGSFTHFVAGNWTNNGGTFNGTGSTIDLTGATKTIGGSSSTTFNNLTLSGGAPTTFAVSTTMIGNLDISTGSQANLGTITTHTANSLSLAQVGQVAGTWGGTGSGATNINTTYFAAATGRLTTAAFGPTTYYSRQTGNWNVASTWSTVTYGNATNTGTFPVAGDYVNIGGTGGVDYTITVAAAAACGSITFQSNTAHSPVLAISSGITLNVSGAITIPRQSAGDINTLAVGAGILNVGSISFTNGGTGAAAERRHVLTISTGTVTVSGNVTQSGSTGSATVTFTSAGLMKIGGTFLNSSECTFTESTGTMEYNGASQSVSNVIYYNLTLSGSGTKTVSSALTIEGNITLGAGITFSSGAFTNNLSGNWINNGATYSGFGSTINLNGTAQSIGGFSSTSFNNLTFSGSGTKTFNISTTINATFSVSTGVVANLNSITTHTAKTLSLGGNGQVPGTWGGTGSAATNINPTFFTATTGILTVTNRIYYSNANGNWNNSGTWSTVTYNGGTNAGTFPTTGDIADIGGTSDRSITVTANAACAFIIYQGNENRNYTIAISSGITLDVSNSITIAKAGGGAKDNILAVGAGILNAGSIVFSSTGSGAQIMTLSTGTATINGDITSSTATADITFSGAGLLQLGGAMYASTGGNLTPGTGTVEYNGAVAQTVSDFTYYGLKLNNTLGTIPGLTLLDNTTVTNTLTMTSGVLNLNSKTLTLGVSATASSLSRTASTTTNWMYGGTFTRFWPASTIITSTSGNFYGLFPMGNSSSSSYRPVAINSTVSPTGTGSYSVSHVNATTVTDLSPVFNDAGTNIVRKHNAQFITSTTVTGGTYNIAVTMTDLGAGTLSDIRLAKNTGATTVTTVGTHVAATGTAPNPTASRSGVILANLSGDWRITTTNATATPLPVELVNFEGKIVGTTIQLNWETASEYENDFFAVERSVDAEAWDELTQIKGAGTTGESTYYKYVDENPKLGRSYYRLRQTDFNGSFAYSPILTMKFEDLLGFRIVPNPSNGIFTLLGIDSSGISFRIINLQGKLLHQAEFLDSGNEMIIDITELPAGMYIIQITDGTTIQSARLIKK